MHYSGLLSRSPRGGKDPVLITDDILQVIEIWKLQKPSIYGAEIRRRLIAEGICNANNVPSVRQLQNVITSIPSEYMAPENLAKVDDYLNITSMLRSDSLHFFDESSVIVTTGNRKYGSAYRGKPAIEIQKYASNANYTVNLLHSSTGVDYFNIFPGASNGQELINFIYDILDMERSDGTRILLPGDTIIMDNCGFHHGHLTKRLVNEMLASRGVQLIFQSPYSPHLNTCELCFRHMKSSLRKNERYAIEQTELAIIDAVNEINAVHSLRYFRHCGYLF